MRNSTICGAPHGADRHTIEPPYRPPSPRPCEILGEKNIGLLKSSGFSSSHTLSSFCQSVSMPSMRRAPCVRVANGGSGGPAGAAAAACGAPARPAVTWLAPLAGAAAADAASTAAGAASAGVGAAGSAPGTVAQPNRKATQADASTVSGEIGRN